MYSKVSSISNLKATPSRRHMADVPASDIRDSIVEFIRSCDHKIVAIPPELI